MITGKLKYVVIALLFIVAILVIAVIYRMYFKFNGKKIKDFATIAASTTSDPNKAYQLITEGAQFILKSQDLTKQVEIAATIDNISREQALIEAALNNCYASGFIEKPNGYQVSTPGTSEAVEVIEEATEVTA